MWSDRFVPRGPASCLYQAPQRDADFENATSSTIWPRAGVAAGSFWNWEAALEPQRLGATMQRVGERVAAAGVVVCPCSTPQRNGCWQSEFCGVGWCT